MNLSRDFVLCNGGSYMIWQSNF